MVVSKQQQFPTTIHLLFSNNLNSQLVHKGYFFIHGMVSIAGAKYNLIITTVEVASWSKFIDGYV